MNSVRGGVRRFLVEFMKAVGGCGTLVLLGLAWAQPAGAAISPRADISLDDGWRFIRQDMPGAQAVDFDDNGWQSIHLPHTWNNLDGEDGGNNYYRGPAWYRRRLRADPVYAGKEIYLKFDGAATVTDVYVNGRSVGEHRGNFGAFCFDVTSFMNHDGDNLIAVRVDNAYNPDIPPLSGDFTVFGGLYRDVHLLALDRLSVTPLDYASPGVFLKQDRVSDRQAKLDIITEIRNVSGVSKRATIKTRITDAKGRLVHSTSTRKMAPDGTTQTVDQHVTLRRPHLWDGVDDPYLYQVTVDVMDGKRVTDEVTQPLGLRYFHVDPNQGLFLDGKHYALHGVDRHQDRLNKGWAISPADHLQDFDLIREMGCTGIRLAHYQHAQYFYSLCDRGGLVVWAELPLVNRLGKSAAFAENARAQLTELIKQSYNHPSILFWSLFNELQFPKPRNAPANPNDWALIVQLNKLAHQLDPTRLTTAASDINPAHPVNFITDLIAFNRYYGWYGGKPGDWPKALDDLHRKYPNRCIAISEYGAGASIYQHEQDPKQPQAGGRWHPEEWQSVVHEAAWKAMETRPFLWGTFIWNMFDFASDGRHEGDTPGRNDKGMMTYDRKTKKDTFFWYKANWTTDPFVYITSRRFTPRAAGPIEVKIYSNCDRVSLNVNGHLIGAQTAPDHIFLWTNVALTTGADRIEAIGEKNGRRVRDSCVITGT